MVLGGSGFLGAQLVRRAALGRAGRVVSMCRWPERAPLPAQGVERCALDLERTTAHELAAELRRLEARAVILSAAMSRLDECERDPGRAMRVNAFVPAEVGSACAEAGVRLVHVSTDLVFGARAPARPRGFTESDPPAPLSAYGQSKLHGERSALGSGADVLVVRLPLLYGDSLGRGLGASDSLLAALGRGETPLLFSDEFRTPLDVCDAADALLELTRGAATGLLHVAGPERVDRVRLGVAVLRSTGLDELEARRRLRIGLRADLGLAATRPADVSLDSSRARGLLATVLRSPAEALGTP